MKKILLITFLVGMMACNKNQSADIKPTDVDQTDNDDTVPRPGNTTGQCPKPFRLHQVVKNTGTGNITLQ